MESWMDSWASVFICYWKPVIAAWCRVPTRCMGLIARKACKIISAYLMAWDGLDDCLSFCMASFHIFKRYFNSLWIVSCRQHATPNTKIDTISDFSRGLDKINRNYVIGLDIQNSDADYYFKILMEAYGIRLKEYINTIFLR